MKIYLDNAATTPLAPEALEEMMPYLTDNFGNPSSIHGYGRKSRAAIEKSRKIVASAINASTAEVFFTSCGTESNNMVIETIGQKPRRLTYHIFTHRASLCTALCRDGGPRRCQR
jgi:cysteine desulfurase